MLGCISDPAEQLELINDLERLGVAYHFENYIKDTLNIIYNKKHFHDHKLPRDDADLHSTAIGFRLFRQHHYAVFQGTDGRYNNNHLHQQLHIILMFVSKLYATPCRCIPLFYG